MSSMAVYTVQMTMVCKVVSLYSNAHGALLNVLQGMAWVGRDGPSPVYSGSLRERIKRMQIGAAIYVWRMGFWLLSCADAIREGAIVHLLRHRARLDVRDQDSLIAH